ncbi:MAG: hypothetical protein AAGC55_18285 [Myxococcota bacterium]
MAIHPFAFLSDLFGPFELVSQTRDGRSLRATLRAAPAGGTGDRPTELELAVEPDTQPGFDFIIDVAGAAQPGSAQHGPFELRAQGGYRPGRGWAFAPLSVDGQPYGPDEGSTSEHDIWFEANCRVVATLVAHLRGELSGELAAARGLIDGNAALRIERGLGPAAPIEDT